MDPWSLWSDLRTCTATYCPVPESGDTSALSPQPAAGDRLPPQVFPFVLLILRLKSTLSCGYPSPSGQGFSKGSPSQGRFLTSQDHGKFLCFKLHKETFAQSGTEGRGCFSLKQQLAFAVTLELSCMHRKNLDSVKLFNHLENKLQEDPCFRLFFVQTTWHCPPDSGQPHKTRVTTRHLHGPK